MALEQVRSVIEGAAGTTALVTAPWWLQLIADTLGWGVGIGVGICGLVYGYYRARNERLTWLERQTKADK